MGGNGQYSISYQSVMSSLNNLDEQRLEMAQALSRLAQKMNSVNDWKGTDAEAFRGVIQQVCVEINSTIGWMNATCGHLKNLAEQKLRDSSELAGQLGSTE